MKKFTKYIPIFIPLLIGTIIGLISNTNNYSVMNKPALSPPAIVFPIVWSILYLLLGISYFLTNKTREINKVYYLNLFLNFIWPILFFNFKLYLISVAVLLLLIINLIELIITFYKDNKTSGYLNILYLIWLLFAFYLNIGVYILN